MQDLFDSDGANMSAKKRKSDKPKKHLGSTVETIVPKKPKNLFMNCLQQIHSTSSTSTTTTTTTTTVANTGKSSSKADEYEFNDDDDSDFPELKLPTLGKHRAATAAIGPAGPSTETSANKQVSPTKALMAKATRKLDLSTSEKELPPPAPFQLKKTGKSGQQCGHMCPPATTSALKVP